MSRKLLLPLIALGLLVFSLVHVVTAQQEKPRLSPPRDPARSSFAHSVAGAGIVEAQTENIAIGSALPGVVLEVYVPVEKVGQRVKAGEPLFQVDNRQLKAQLKYNEANLAAAEANLAKLDAQPRAEEVPPSEASVRVAQAQLNMQLDTADRSRSLVRSGSVSDEDFRQKALAVEMGKRSLEHAKAQDALLKAGAWDKDKAIARASIALAKAQMEQTQ